MPRRNRTRGAAPAGAASPRELAAGAVSWSRTQTAPDGDWIVRSVPGARGQKSYRCPGCDQLIAAGVVHVVAWPAGSDEHTDLEQRRHWHSACWAARDRRRPGSRAR